MSRVKPSALCLLAMSEWILVLPATVLLGAGALRLLQPRQYEPARTSWIIFEWATTHISHLGAAILLVGLPVLAAGSGCVALARLWRKNQTFREEAGIILTIIRRNPVVGFLALATLLGTVVLAAAVVHVIAD